jgi:2-polyprenyl-3-methyl-5-hydroxy-6-metoxy-1,4-benzoquinol methylase
MSLEILKSCPVCQSNSFNNYLNVEDYTVSKKEFTIQQCNACYFLFTNPRPDIDEIGAYYKSEEYISHHDEAKNIMSKIYTSVRNYTISQKIKLINQLYPKPGSLLDIGCGTGNFLQATKQAGWKITGTEPDSEARKVAGNRVGETIQESINASELSGRQFDIITMWHVLEHVHLLNETIDWLSEHLTSEGKIIIAVPNPQSADAAYYRRFWAAYDVPRHLYHFTKDSMALLMKKHGFKIDTIHPMWFDSFYVSMLSTKYKSRKIDLFDSIKTGVLSNLKGKSSQSKDLNTSSLIYVISKI